MLILALTLTAAAAPRCDVNTLTEVRDVLPQLDLDQRPELAAQAIAETCKLPKRVGEALSQVAMSPPSMRSALDMQLVVAAPNDWAESCSGGLAVAQRVAQGAPSARRALLWKECGGASGDWMSEAEWSAAPGLQLAPILARHWLREAGVADEVARAYVRALAGVEDERVVAEQEAIVREFEPLYP